MIYDRRVNLIFVKMWVACVKPRDQRVRVRQPTEACRDERGVGVSLMAYTRFHLRGPLAPLAGEAGRDDRSCCRGLTNRNDPPHGGVTGDSMGCRWGDYVYGDGGLGRDGGTGPTCICLGQANVVPLLVCFS